MSTYGITIYGKDLYGYSGPQSIFSVDPMVAAQSDYGVLQISWTTPSQAGGATYGSWTRQRLVRNSYGIPDTEADGVVLLDEAAGSTSTQYLDNSVVPGDFYYYAIFVATGINTYSSTTTYQPGDIVVSSGITYICLVANTTGVTPAGNPSTWQVTTSTQQWVRCGQGTVGLVVKDSGYRGLVYDLVPLPYKVALVETTASNVPVNDDLYDFTSLFGFSLDVMKSEHDGLLRMNDIMACTDRQLGFIAQQMGISDRLPALPELRRSFVRDADSIQRASGSGAALAELMHDLTGWPTVATTSYNLMPTNDSATFASSLAGAWNKDRAYFAGASGSVTYDLVSYQGTVYAAKAGTSVVACYLLSPGAVTNAGGTVTFVRDSLAGARNKGYVTLTGGIVGSTITFTITPNANLVGTSFNLYVRFVRDPAGGIVTCTLNGTLVAGWSHDLYSGSRVLDQPIFIPHSAGNSSQTVQFNITGQNPLSSGLTVLVDEIWFQTQSGSGPQNIGVQPTGASGSATFWTTTLGANEVPDIDTERDMLTDGQNVWSYIDPLGVVNPRPDNAQGGATPSMTCGVIPLGDSVGTSPPNIGGSLSYQLNTGSPGKVTLSMGGIVQAPAYSSSTPYLAGQPATWTLPATVPTLTYVAKNYTLGNAPDQFPTKWSPQQFTASPTQNADPLLLPTHSILMPQITGWSSTVAYTKGQVVRHRGTLYQAAQSVPVSVAPTGLTTDNPWWRWMGPASQTYTFSAFHYRTATATGVNIRPGLDWFDSAGNFLGHAGSTDGKTQVWDGFNNYAETIPSSGSGTPPAGWSTPAVWHQGTGIPWVYQWGSWGVVDDMAVPTGWNALGATTVLNARSAGRFLWYDRTWLYSGTLVDTLYVTFRSAPFDPTYTMEHGIGFRYNPANGYWLASRDRLSWTSLTFTSGTLTAVTNTVMATWTPLTDGTRMKVNVNASTVTVYAMTSAQPGVWVQLATVSSTQFNSQTGVGILERIHI